MANIAIIENINEKPIASIVLPISVIFELLYNLYNSKEPAAAIVGIESNIENFAASLRFTPQNLAIVIVMPERLVPGIKAKHCAKPINKASLKLISDVFLEFCPFLSATYKSSP